MTERDAPKGDSDTSHWFRLPKELRLMVYAYLAYPYRKDTILMPAAPCPCIPCRSCRGEIPDSCMCVYCMRDRVGGTIKRPPAPIPLTLITPCQYPQAILTCRTFYTEITSYMDSTKRPVDRAYTTPRAIIDITNVVNDDDVVELLEDVLNSLNTARNFRWGIDGDVYDPEDNGSWNCLLDESSMAHAHRFIKASGRHLFNVAAGAWIASHDYDYVREMRGELVPENYEQREELVQQILAVPRGPHDGLNLLFLGKEWDPVGYMDRLLSKWKITTYKSRNMIDVPIYLYRETDEPIKAIEGPRGLNDWEEGYEEYYDDEIQLQDMGQISRADWLEYWA
ncbi:hypothetical protein P171DRAFT_433069 [Karstenula rhodostoma CBS 690.94]|uniref:Uncharacterized protein n=1 Tax=Karstenula rhodostoma CBS 690.94 TaxID=1392251 RepID=A0A9P4PET4_9PLEO|nr:hypothetical protein P171DRAFT_433069 [Karstenula rhodostoma CBS 690.94]